MAGIMLFIAASLAGGLATSPGMLLGARFVQGIGGAMLSPAALSLLTTSFGGDARARALGIYGAIGGAGGAAGVLFGGLLTSGWPPPDASRHFAQGRFVLPSEHGWRPSRQGGISCPHKRGGGRKPQLRLGACQPHRNPLARRRASPGTRSASGHAPGA